MKKLLMMLIVIGMLISVGTTYADFPEAFVSATDVVDVIVIGSINNSGDRLIQNNLNIFLQQERSIGAIGRYNYNYLTSSYRIGPISKTQWEWQYWNMINSKLGKYLER